ncbi:SDR family oxidoreductase [Actinomadura miaoliensis]|uniref:3-oxoacyl-[acyl-carrier-protein] reductase n=1 Tax=Actinomadura miaoliensis TaxID=430685 RepID=A0ABP7W9J9_9ACTN
MGQVALITGASRGIGAATAVRLGRRGFHVVVNYRGDAAAARKVVEEIEASGGTARAVRADVRDPRDAARLVDACPGLDVLVCNANVQPPFAAFADMSWEAFREKVDGELAAAFHVSKRALEVMRTRRSGRVVYVSSLSAELTRPGAIAHATAKAALDAFARHVAMEAGAYGVGVNVVAPGAVRTDATAHMLTPEREAAIAKTSVLGRMVEPDDVASVIAALVTGELAAVAGTRIPVDAGSRVLGGQSR